MNSGKRGDISIGVIISIVIGVVVLIVLIYGFTSGWSNAWNKIMGVSGLGEDNIGDMQTFCSSACAQMSEYSFCTQKKTLTSVGTTNKGEKYSAVGSFTCKEMESILYINATSKTSYEIINETQRDKDESKKDDLELYIPLNVGVDSCSSIVC
jgi:hypothetical protein